MQRIGALLEIRNEKTAWIATKNRNWRGAANRSKGIEPRISRISRRKNWQTWTSGRGVPASIRAIRVIRGKVFAKRNDSDKAASDPAMIRRRRCGICNYSGRDASPRRPGGEPLRRWTRHGQRGALSLPARAQDRNLRILGRAALLRRPRIQGRAAALPYREAEEICPAPYLNSHRDFY